MKKKSYTVREIDALRGAVENRYLWGNANGASEAGFSRTYKESEMRVDVEEQVRTYMLAGITAQALCKADK